MKLRDVNRLVLGGFAVTAAVWLVLFAMKPPPSTLASVRWAPVDERDGGPALADPHAAGMPWSPSTDDDDAPALADPLAPPPGPTPDEQIMDLATSGKRAEQRLAEAILRERIASGNATPMERTLFRGLCRAFHNCDGASATTP